MGLYGFGNRPGYNLPASRRLPDLSKGEATPIVRLILNLGRDDLGAR